MPSNTNRKIVGDLAYFALASCSQVLGAEDDATMANDDDMTTRLMLEQIREDIKKLGEGYEDGLRRLSEEIKEINKEWVSKWSPHDLAIRNHEKRIRVLEHRRPRQSAR